MEPVTLVENPKSEEYSKFLILGNAAYSVYYIVFRPSSREAVSDTPAQLTQFLLGGDLIGEQAPECPSGSRAR